MPRQHLIVGVYHGQTLLQRRYAQRHVRPGCKELQPDVASQEPLCGNVLLPARAVKIVAVIDRAIQKITVPIRNCKTHAMPPLC